MNKDDFKPEISCPKIFEYFRLNFKISSKTFIHSEECSRCRRPYKMATPLSSASYVCINIKAKILYSTKNDAMKTTQTTRRSDNEMKSKGL